jgi:hypothetical protein
MKKKIITSLPEIFSLLPNSDYSRFVPKGTVQERTKQRWEAIGSRLYFAIEAVEPYVLDYDKKKKKTNEAANNKATGSFNSPL